VREEALLFAGLACCAAGVLLTREPGHLESALWLVVLGLQAFPYVAALACAAMARLPESPAGALVPGPLGSAII
jgi:Flp pilus assembly protein protease CpaA